ncbi:MAG: hydrogenase maturation protease [bacterium]|nr:hydrogenase maturation protease [bacterium]
MKFLLPERQLLVLGIGNLIMGDEGVGVHAIERLEPLADELNADVVDGGTGGFHLLNLLDEYPYIILIDATLDNGVEGEVKVIEPRYTTDYPKSLSAHDIGFKDLIESAAALGSNPKVYLIIISIKELQNMMLELSPAVEASLDTVVSEVKRLAAKVHEEMGVAANS